MNKNSQPNKLENIFGWIGAIILLSAYALNALGYVNADSQSYILLNLVGGILVMYVSYRYRNYQSALINLVWFIVALIALVKLSTL